MGCASSIPVEILEVPDDLEWRTISSAPDVTDLSVRDLNNSLVGGNESQWTIATTVAPFQPQKLTPEPMDSPLPPDGDNGLHSPTIPFAGTSTTGFDSVLSEQLKAECDDAAGADRDNDAAWSTYWFSVASSDADVVDEPSPTLEYCRMAVLCAAKRVKCAVFSDEYEGDPHADISPAYSKYLRTPGSPALVTIDFERVQLPDEICRIVEWRRAVLPPVPRDRTVHPRRPKCARRRTATLPPAQAAM